MELPCPDCKENIPDQNKESRFLSCPKCEKLYDRKCIESYWLGYYRGLKRVMELISEDGE